MNLPFYPPYIYLFRPLYTPAIRRIPQYLHKPSSSVVEQTFIYKIEISIIYNFKKERNICILSFYIRHWSIYLYDTNIILYVNLSTYRTDDPTVSYGKNKGLVKTRPNLGTSQEMTSTIIPRSIYL